MWHLRLANAGDEDAIRDLTREAYAKWVPLLGREPVPMTADYAAALRAHRFDLLFVEGELAGLIETIAHPDHLHVENVAVRPVWQGRGLGHDLLAHAEQIARTVGVGTLKLHTNKLFAENLRLYATLGYTVETEADFRGGTVVHLSKSMAG